MTIRILDPKFNLIPIPSSGTGRPRGTPDRREWSRRRRERLFLAGRKTTATTEKRTQTCQKQRNARRSLALPVGLPFSLVLSFWHLKKVQMPEKSVQNMGYNQSESYHRRDSFIGYTMRIVIKNKIGCLKWIQTADFGKDYSSTNSCSSAQFGHYY